MTAIFLLFMFAVFPRNSGLEVNLGSVCQDMWNKATNNLMISPSELTVNPVKDSAAVFQLNPSETKTKTAEFVSFKGALESLAFRNAKKEIEAEARENDFLSEICKEGGPMEVALKFLEGKQKIALTDPFGLSCLKELRMRWFGNGQHTGFEHTFIGQEGQDPKGSKVFIGFHNWYQFYIQQVEQKKITKVLFVLPQNKWFEKDTQPPLMSGLKFVWDGATKGGFTTLFVGTSPAFEMALFSTCFHMMASNGQSDVCTCNIGKSLVDVKVLKTKNKQKILTAYPNNMSIRPGACTIANYHDRTDCSGGFIGINEEGCEKRGCCWSQAPGTWPWCFYPTGHKCHGIPPMARIDCGDGEITRQECENTRSCCFDNHNPNVPSCFKGNP